MLAGLWILIVFGWRISGSQFNPAITFAYMFRKDSKSMPKALGIAYMLFQVLGAVAAGLILLFFTNGNVGQVATIGHCYACNYDPGTGICGHTGVISGCVGIEGQDFYVRHFVFEACLQETLGTFVVVIFFMMMTDETMLFSREKAINCFIIACGYISARAMFNGTRSVNYFQRISLLGSCLNPGIALGIFFAALLDGSYGWDAFSSLWIYVCMPFVGSLISLLFYEFIYKKT
jgi:glycerol uptake facilitator-like aquaporin